MLMADKLVPSVGLYDALSSRSDSYNLRKDVGVTSSDERTEVATLFPASRAELGRILHPMRRSV